MTSKGYGACKGEQITGADAGEEVPPGGSGRRGQQQQTSKSEERADGGGPARCRNVGWPQDGNSGEKWNEDNYQSRDESGFSGGGTGQACGLELVTGGEEQANNDARVQGRAGDVKYLTVINES